MTEDVCELLRQALAKDIFRNSRWLRLRLTRTAMFAAMLRRRPRAGELVKIGRNVV